MSISMGLSRGMAGCVFLFFLSVGISYADTLYLKNGRSLDGIVKHQDNRSVELEVCSGSVIFKRDEVARVEIASPEAAEALRSSWSRSKNESGLRALQEQMREAAGPQGFEYSPETNSIVVKAVLNGRLRVDLLLDTGASLVVLKKEIADELGINVRTEGEDVTLILADGKRVRARFVILDRVAAAGMEVPHIEAAILTEDVSDLLHGQGLLGMSFLKRFNFKIDHRNQRLILEAL